MARLFDDVSSEYLVNANAVASGVPLAMACWFTYDDGTSEDVLMAISDFSSWGDFFNLRMDAYDHYIRAQDDAVASSTAAATINTWHHACGVWAATDDRAAFLDGGNKGTNVTDTTIANLDTTVIGAGARGGSYERHWSGGIAEAGIWSLTDWPGATAADKAAEFERVVVPALGLGFSPTFFMLGLLAYWPLLRTDNDLVGGYDMTPYNDPAWADHPPMIYPAPPLWVSAPSAGGPTNYPVSLTLGRQAGASAGASAAGLAGATLGRQAGLADGGAAAAGGSLSLAMVRAVTQAAVAAAVGDTTLSNLRGISEDATAAAAASFTTSIYEAIGLSTGLTASLTLARSLASNLAAVAAARANASLGEALGAAFSGQAAAGGALDLTKVLQVAASALAAAAAMVAVARSLGASFVVVEAEVAAAIALTLQSRDLALTLQERSLALRLVARALGLTLPERE